MVDRRRLALRQFILGVPGDPFPTLKDKLRNPCLQVVIRPREGGRQDLELLACDHPPNTTFSLFLTENPTPPFGAAAPVAQYTTGPAGTATLLVPNIASILAAAGIQSPPPPPPPPLPPPPQPPPPPPPPGPPPGPPGLGNMVVWFASPQDAAFLFPLGMNGQVVESSPATLFGGIAILTTNPTGVGTGPMGDGEDPIPQEAPVPEDPDKTALRDALNRLINLARATGFAEAAGNVQSAGIAEARTLALRQSIITSRRGLTVRQTDILNDALGLVIDLSRRSATNQGAADTILVAGALFEPEVFSPEIEEALFTGERVREGRIAQLNAQYAADAADKVANLVMRALLDNRIEQLLPGGQAQVEAEPDPPNKDRLAQGLPLPADIAPINFLMGLVRQSADNGRRDAVAETLPELEVIFLDQFTVGQQFRKTLELMGVPEATIKRLEDRNTEIYMTSGAAAAAVPTTEPPNAEQLSTQIRRLASVRRLIVLQRSELEEAIIGAPAAEVALAPPPVPVFPAVLPPIVAGVDFVDEEARIRTLVMGVIGARTVEEARTATDALLEEIDRFTEQVMLQARTRGVPAEDRVSIDGDLGRMSKEARRLFESVVRLKEEQAKSQPNEDIINAQRAIIGKLAGFDHETAEITGVNGTIESRVGSVAERFNATREDAAPTPEAPIQPNADELGQKFTEEAAVVSREEEDGLPEGIGDAWLIVGKELTGLIVTLDSLYLAAARERGAQREETIALASTLLEKVDEAATMLTGLRLQLQVRRRVLTESQAKLIAGAMDRVVVATIQMRIAASVGDAERVREMANEAQQILLRVTRIIAGLGPRGVNTLKINNLIDFIKVAPGFKEEVVGTFPVVLTPIVYAADTTVPNGDEISANIRRLASEDIAERERGMDAMINMVLTAPDDARNALIDALEAATASPDPEVAARATRVLNITIERRLEHIEDLAERANILNASLLTPEEVEFLDGEGTPDALARIRRADEASADLDRLRSERITLQTELRRQIKIQLQQAAQMLPGDQAGFFADNFLDIFGLDVDFAFLIVVGDRSTAREFRERLLRAEAFLRATMAGQMPDFREAFGVAIFNALQAWRRRNLTPVDTRVDVPPVSAEERKRDLLAEVGAATRTLEGATTAEDFTDMVPAFLVVVNAALNSWISLSLIEFDNLREARARVATKAMSLGLPPPAGTAEPAPTLVERDRAGVEDELNRSIQRRLDRISPLMRANVILGTSGMIASVVVSGLTGALAELGDAGFFGGILSAVRAALAGSTRVVLGSRVWAFVVDENGVAVRGRTFGILDGQGESFDGVQNAQVCPPALNATVAQISATLTRATAAINAAARVEAEALIDLGAGETTLAMARFGALPVFGAFERSFALAAEAAANIGAAIVRRGISPSGMPARRAGR